MTGISRATDPLSMPTFLSTPLTCLLTLAGLAAAPAAQAQAGAGDTVGVALSHDSVLGRYKRFEDQAISPWRETNDTVGRRGGWRAYAQEKTPDSAAAPTPRPAAAHQGHEGHNAGPGGKP